MSDELLFEIGDDAAVTSLGIKGKVTAIYIDGNGANFQVQYLDSTGRVQRYYFTADQLEPA